MDEIKNEQCPFCHEKKLILREEELDIPYFGKCYLMSMTCSNCRYHKSDVEAVDKKDPVKLTFIVKDKKDLNVRVVKSSEATVKIPQLKMDVEPGASSIGYITNIEGLLARFKSILEDQRDNSDDDETRKSAKKLLKKLWKIELGEMELKIIIEDPSGNSAIISDKTEVKKL